MLMLVLSLFSVSCFAQEKVALVRRILPEHVEQDSIKMERFSTNTFLVRFTLTEAAKRDYQAFDLKHAGQQCTLEIGSYKGHTMIPPADSSPAGWTNDVWRKQMQAVFNGISEDNAKKIISGLKSK